VAHSTDPAPGVSPALAVHHFEDLIALAADKRDLQIKAALERDVRLVRYEDGKLEIALEPNASKTLVNDLARKLSDWTGRRWMVVVSAEAGQPTVKSQNDARRTALERGVQGDPLVQAVLARFPGAQIVAVRAAGDATAPGLPSAEDAPPEFVDDDTPAFGTYERPHGADNDV